MWRFKTSSFALVVCLCVLPLNAWAIPAFVQGNLCTTSINSNTITCQFPGTVTTGNLIAFGVFYDFQGTSTIVSVADDCGNSYTLADTNVGDNFDDGAQGYKSNVTGGSACTITATFTGTTTGWRLIVMHEVSGLVSSNALDCHSMQGTQNGTTISSGSCITTNNGDYLFGSTGNAETWISFTCSQGSGYSLRENSNGLCSEDQVQSSAGNTSATFSIATNSDSVTGLMAFIATGGGGGGAGAPGGRTLSLTGVGR